MGDGPAAPDRSAIRDAATLILIRRDAAGARVLMGQRGATAAFMPSKFVFPGGAVDPGDAGAPLAVPLPEPCAARLVSPGGPAPEAMAAAAIRELWEEAGLILGCPGDWPVPPPPDWQGFAATGHRPAGALRFVFRAITPPGRPRRFDARFFLADATDVAGDPDDFGRASDELGHLSWVPLAQAQALNLPFITEVVLAEVAADLARGDLAAADAGVPFFDNSGPQPRFMRLGGHGRRQGPPPGPPAQP